MEVLLWLVIISICILDFMMAMKTLFMEGLFKYMEKAMAPHSSTLDWKLPWKEEPGRLQSMGLRRVAHE